MRTTLFIILLLQVLPGSGQSYNARAATLEEVLETAMQQNPLADSAPGKKVLVRDIKSVWHQWLYYLSRKKVLEEYTNLLNDIERITLLRYTTGDIDQLTRLHYLDKLASVQTDFVSAEIGLDMAGNNLQLLLCSQSPVVPSDSALTIYQIDKGTVNLNSGKNLLTTHKQLVLDSLFVRLQYYYQAGLPYAGALLQVQQARLAAEEIEYLEWAVEIEKAFAIKLGYLKTLNQYNQHAIELEYYAW
ncbi:MAG: TolC family protein [Bacteroidales bacterium]|nr:TolC family protein [Bacteroidales bacterium]